MDTETAIEIVHAETLDEVVRAMLDFQVRPIDVMREKLDGSSVLGDPLVQAVKRFDDYLMGASNNEIDAIADSFHPNQSLFFEVDAVKARQTRQVEEMALNWISHLANERMQKGELSPMAPIENGRVWNRFPKLRRFFSDEHLLRLDSELEFHPWGVHFEDHVIHYSPFLGVSRSSSPDSDLQAFLCHHASSTNNSVGIAIDGRCITPLNKYRRMEYRDYWRGRPFERSDLDDPYKVGVTVHTAPDPKTARQIAVACRIAGIDRTEFFWKCKEGVKTFEAEEVIGSDRKDAGRYLHAEYQLNAKCFRHLDGAIMLYSESDRIRRGEPNCVLPNTPRANPKPKLFRIDGAITVEQWSSALCLFFRSNPLVHEYLAGSTGPSVDFVSTTP